MYIEKDYDKIYVLFYNGDIFRGDFNSSSWNKEWVEKWRDELAEEWGERNWNWKQEELDADEDLSCEEEQKQIDLFIEEEKKKYDIREYVLGVDVSNSKVNNKS